MFSSLDKVDIVVDEPGRKLGVQTDHRAPEEILGSWELSALFALTRALNPRRYEIVDRVRFSFANPPPGPMQELCVAAGADVEVVGSPLAEGLPDDARVDAIATEALRKLGAEVLGRWNVTSEAGLSVLQTRFAEQFGTADEEDEITRWTAVVELGAAVGELILRKYPSGRWVRDPQRFSTIPFVMNVEGGFTMVFGKVEKFLHHGPSESPAQLFQMIGDHAEDDGPLMLNLRPSDWAGKGQALVLEGLLPSMENLEGNDIPLVAVVRDLPNTVRTLPLDEPTDRDVLRAEALANLRRLEVEVGELDGGGMTLLIVHGGYYASEKLLDDEFMRGLHARLGSELLMAAVPVKGELWVGSALADPSKVAGFAGFMHKRHADAPPNQRLSTELFLVSEGRVEGVARARGSDEAESASPTAAAAEPGPAKRKGFWARLFGG